MPAWLIAILPNIIEGLIQIIEDWINSRKSMDTVTADDEAQIYQAQKAITWLKGYQVAAPADRADMIEKLK